MEAREVQPSAAPERRQYAAAETQRLGLVRKLIHMAMAVVPAAGWWFSHQLALAMAGGLVVLSMALEASRRWWPRINQLLWRLLPTTFREWEDQRVLGSTWFSLGAALVLVVFGRDVGGTALLFLAWGDPSAEFAGRRWGRPGKRKTLPGSVACLAACGLAALVGATLGGLSAWAVLVGAVVATAVERWSPPPDDNLWMPILSGLAIALVQATVGGEALW